jgi:propionyl-CoA synthetase
MGVPVGLFLSNVVFFGIRTLPPDVRAWAWRVPFLLSSLLVVLGLYIRLSVAESPMFDTIKQNCSKLPLLDKAIELAGGKPERCVILQRQQYEASMKRGRDADWSELMARAQPAGYVPVAATDPLYILYTSGTTGAPKGVVRDNGGHLVALKWSMKHVYSVEPGEVFWAASDLGWAVGHSYTVYGPLFHGNTTVLYEGKPVGTPDPGTFWRVISEHKVSALFTAPTAFRAIKREDPTGEHLRRYDLSRFRTLFLAGERCDPATLLWAEQQLGVPVVDNWWQTETGWPIGASCVGLGLPSVKPGSCGRAVPGYDVRVLSDEGLEAPSGQTGNIVLKLPLPPGCLPTLWENDAGYRESYLNSYPGYYKTADAGYKDEDGYLWIMGRTDDIINVARPHRETVAELVAMVREKIGPVASFKVAIVVRRLPKTRSGKIVRGIIKKIADGNDYRIPPTIEDPAIFDEIAADLAAIGYPHI